MMIASLIRCPWIGQRPANVKRCYNHINDSQLLSGEGLQHDNTTARSANGRPVKITEANQDVKGQITMIGVSRDTCKSGHRTIVSHASMKGCCHGEPERASDCTASSSADRCEGS